MAAHVEDSKQHLEKELSPLSVCALAFGCIIGLGAFVMPGNTFLPRSGPLGTALGMLVASGIMIVIACNYHFMIKRFPVAGGGFIFAKHSFGDRHAFFCGWFLVLSYAALVPMNATALALIMRNLWGDVFQHGIEYRMMGNPIYLWEVMIAVIAILFFGVLCIVGVKQVGNFQILLTVALFVGVALVCVPAVFSPVSVFPEPLIRPGQSSFSAVVAILAVAPWAFVDFDTVPQSAEEYKFSPNKTRLIMVVSILFDAFVYVALNTLTASVIPQRFSNWYEYIQQVPSLSGIEALPTFNAAYRLLGWFGLAVLSVAVFGAILSGLLGFFMASSRLVYSMAVSNILPV